MGWQGQNTQGRELDCPRGKGRVKQHTECTQDPQERRVSLEQTVNPDKPSLEISPSRDTGCLLWGGSGGGSRRRCLGPWRAHCTSRTAQNASPGPCFCLCSAPQNWAPSVTLLLPGALLLCPATRLHYFTSTQMCCVVLRIPWR